MIPIWLHEHGLTRVLKMLNVKLDVQPKNKIYMMASTYKNIVS